MAPARSLLVLLSVAIASGFLAAQTACVTVAQHPCTKGGQPARADGKIGKGTKQCLQVRDTSGNFVNQGRYVEWHTNGVRAIEGEYAGGFKTGKWIEWDEQGRKLTEKWFEGGNEVPGREEKPYNGLGPPPLPKPRVTETPAPAASAAPSAKP